MLRAAKPLGRGCLKHAQGRLAGRDLGASCGTVRLGTAKEGTDKTTAKLPCEMLTEHLLAVLKGWPGRGCELAKKLEQAGRRGDNTAEGCCKKSAES